MTTALDTKLTAKALELIVKFGKDASIEVFTTKAYDPSSGKTTFVPVLPALTAVKIIPPTAVKAFMEGDILRDADIKTGIAAKDLTVTIEIGMIIIIDSEKWKIVKVQKVYSGDNVALFKLQLRL